MSGYTDNTIVHHGVLERGINYIQKPFTVGALAGKVREVLDNKDVSVKSPFAKGDSGWDLTKVDSLNPPSPPFTKGGKVIFG